MEMCTLSVEGILGLSYSFWRRNDASIRVIAKRLSIALEVQRPKSLIGQTLNEFLVKLYSQQGISTCLFEIKSMDIQSPHVESTRSILRMVS